MTEKKLQKGSQYEHLDIDNNGIITDGEMAIAQKMEQLQHQREMNQNLYDAGIIDSDLLEKWNARDYSKKE